MNAVYWFLGGVAAIVVLLCYAALFIEPCYLEDMDTDYL